MNADDKFVITPDEAISLLNAGDTIHNFAMGGPIIIGCDFSRDGAVAALKRAVLIEIGGDGCKRMKHPIVTWDTDDHYTFFEADMEKVAALEASRLEAPSIPVKAAIASLPTELHDFQTHRQSWRDALVLAAENAAPPTSDALDDKGYWEHELRAYDFAMAALDAHCARAIEAAK